VLQSPAQAPQSCIRAKFKVWHSCALVNSPCENSLLQLPLSRRHSSHASASSNSGPATSYKVQLWYCSLCHLLVVLGNLIYHYLLCPNQGMSRAPTTPNYPGITAHSFQSPSSFPSALSLAVVLLSPLKHSEYSLSVLQWRQFQKALAPVLEPSLKFST
jgi:hypothetical protein